MVAQEENYKPRFALEQITPILQLFPEEQERIIYFHDLTQDASVIVFERIKQGFYNGMR